MRIALWLALLPAVASAADLDAQVRLTSTTGDPLSGSYDLTVSLSDSGAAGAGTACHTEGPTSIVFEAGYARIPLTDVAPECVRGERWLVFESDGLEVAPRQPLAGATRALTADHVAGYVDLAVQTGTEVGGACAVTGRLVYDTAAGVLSCVEGTWQSVGGGAQSWRDGSTAARASRTCDTLHSTHPNLISGVYWIDPDGDGNTADAWQAWCDMTRNGGGWTLVMQNIQSVTPNPTSTFAQSTTQNSVVGGPMTAGLGTFDLIVALQEWPQIGTEGRVEVGYSAGVPSQQATYSTFTVTGAEYTLSMGGQLITLGSGQPGIFATHNGRNWATSDRTQGTSCPGQYGNQPWWYNSCWSGSMWGYNTNEGARWTGSDGVGSSIQRPWGALWVR